MRSVNKAAANVEGRRGTGPVEHEIILTLTPSEKKQLMNLSSRLLEDAVQEFEQLPGIGRKTALRLVLHLLRSSPEEVNRFGDTLKKMRAEIRFCKTCFNVSEAEECSICLNPRRNQQQICVVESLREVIAIENTNQYQGTYHILGGVISPVDGIGPEQLNLEPLIARVKEKGVEELIMALSPTIPGDTTLFYISKRLQDLPVKITTLARGVAFGGELEYTDDLTLARSLATRTPYENYLVMK